MYRFGTNWKLLDCNYYYDIKVPPLPQWVYVNFFMQMYVMSRKPVYPRWTSTPSWRSLSAKIPVANLCGATGLNLRAAMTLLDHLQSLPSFSLQSEILKNELSPERGRKPQTLISFVLKWLHSNLLRIWSI